MHTVNENIENILFPRETTQKHPNAAEVIKLAEIHGIGVSEIADLLGKSQPYISQVKAGKSNLKTAEIQPLLSRISPRMPGTEYHQHNIFKSYRLVFQKTWEQDFITKHVNRLEDCAYYKFEHLQEDHLRGLQKTKHLEPRYALNLPFNKRTLEELESLIKSYTTERKSRDLNSVNVQRNLDHCIEKFSPILSGIQDKSAFESALDTLIRPYIALHNPESRDKGFKDIESKLLDLCRTLTTTLSLPEVMEEGSSYQALEQHALLIAEKYREELKNQNEHYKNERSQIELTGHYKKDALKYLKQYEYSYDEEVNFADLGRQLFGVKNQVIFLEYGEQLSFQIAAAFTYWAQNNITCEIQEEPIQICGTPLLPHESNDKIIIYELYSQTFIALKTLTVQGKSTRQLSERFGVDKLLGYLEDNDAQAMLEDVKRALVERGYRVPGVRPIY